MRADAVANRKRILAAAGDVFGELGVEASTDEVARRAGVGIGTVFRHFPTKRDLVEATLVEHLQELTARAEDLGGSGEPAPALHALLRELARAGSTKLSLAAALGGGEHLSEATTAASQALRAAVGRALTGAQRSGEVRPDVSVDEVYLLLRGLAQAQATTPVPGAVRRRAVDVLIDGLAVPRTQSGRRSR